LEHPGIVPVYGLGQYADGRPFYAMRFIKGDNLKEAIRRFHEADKPGRDPGERSLSLRQLLRRFIDVCNAVAYAHSRGVLHRDLKPGNIMLGKYGETLIIDWGLAKPSGTRPTRSVSQAFDERTLRPSFDSGLAATQMGSAIGTPGYMSPEQALGDLDRLGSVSDVYSLGATLYALLTGQAPFPERDKAELLEKVRNGDFPRPRQVKGSVPVALEAICLKAMALNPADRYATATALAADVEHWLADEPVSAYGEPWPVRAGRWMRRHRTAVTAAAAALLVAAVSLALATAQLTAANHRLEEANGRESEARATAQANFQMARDAVERYLTKVTDNPRLQVGGLNRLRKELLQEAAEFYTRFIRERADDPSLEADLADAHFKRALIAFEMGSAAEAVDDYRHAAVLYQKMADAHPDNPRYQRALASSHRYLGAAYRGLLSKLTEAEREFQRALALQKKLLETDPANPDYQSDLARTYSDLGSVHELRGQFTEAEQLYLQSLEVANKMSKASSDLPLHRRNVANTYYGLGRLYVAQRQLTKAEQSWQQAIRIYKKNIETDASQPKYRRDLGSSYHNLAVTYSWSGRLGEAEQEYLRALAVKKPLAEEYQDVPDYQADLARTRGDLGHVYAERGDTVRAEREYLAFRDISKKLHDAYLKIPLYQLDLARAYGYLGDLYQRQGKNAEAEQSFQVGVDLAQELADAHPDNADYKTWLQKLKTRKARQKADQLARQGDHAAASAAVQPLVEAKQSSGSTLYDAACIYSLCSAAARKDGMLATAERDKLAEQYASRALDLLRQAIQKGYKDTEHMKKDKDLDALRDREDFKKLVAELEAAKPPEKAPAEP
jgi:serine/threonine-protein kinase